MKKSKKKTSRVLQSFLKSFFLNSLYPLFIFLRTAKTFKKAITKKKNFTKFHNNLCKINDNEFKITSQNNEDGIIEYIFRNIPNNKYFIEIGFGFNEFNSLNLIKNNWAGRLIDFNIEEVTALRKNLNFYFPKHKIEIINSKVTIDNINKLVFHNRINEEIDFFSLDIDGNDYWVLKSMNLSKIKVICCEYNHWLGSELKLVMKYDPDFNFVDNGIFGASLMAFTEMLKEKDFSLVAIDSSGTNAFFVKNIFVKDFEILCPKKNFVSVGRFYNEEEKKKIFKNIKESKLIVQL